MDAFGKCKEKPGIPFKGWTPAMPLSLENLLLSDFNLREHLWQMNCIHICYNAKECYYFSPSQNCNPTENTELFCVGLKY